MSDFPELLHTAFPELLHTALDAYDCRGLADFYQELLGLR